MRIETGTTNKKIDRRRFVKTLFCGAAGAVAACAIDGYFLEPEWIQTMRINLPLHGLDPVFAGRRIVHLTDLHHSEIVGASYLTRSVEMVNALAPDAVVLTGDYVTMAHDRRYIQGVLEIMARISCPLGVYAVCGNHDYGIWRTGQSINSRSLSAIVDGMAARNINVLRNKSAAITLAGRTLWLVGLGDFWAGDLKPEQAFANIPPDEPRIVLVHNPDALDFIADFRADAVLCGHTHGGQVRMPFFGPPVLPVRNRQYSAGLYTVGERLLYVNRGLGRFGGIRGRVRFNCRPEIAVFTLRQRD